VKRKQNARVLSLRAHSAAGLELGGDDEMRLKVGNTQTVLFPNSSSP